MTKTSKPGRMVKAILETIDDMLRIGIMDAAMHAKITMRHLGPKTTDKETLPRISAVSLGNKPLTLFVGWQNGDESLIDLSRTIESFTVYAPLRNAPSLFEEVKVGEQGTEIVWTDDIDMSADTLWRLVQENLA